MLGDSLDWIRLVRLGQVEGFCETLYLKCRVFLDYLSVYQSHNKASIVCFN